ncbi:hypothetical protein HRI_004529800 [Hibiscus trionum]|uniref:Retrovirus-related Pol polyprotein from transposon TNT 1-94 n=1 Tax=Hibiscus trionum TaxID=183268 RepID=A0A9W7MTE6_HIBTR|nr:hypothetical protein HRI_004529800 [Hibiscus trionum]
MRKYLLKVKSICDNLVNCGEQIFEHEHVTAILNDLPLEYESVITVLTDGAHCASVDSARTLLLDDDARQNHLNPHVTAFAHNIVVSQSRMIPHTSVNVSYSVIAPENPTYSMNSKNASVNLNSGYPVNS